ncbi:hypothetical protein BDFB_003251 [Asbolus verrucosus]|uniref:Ribosome biogenesis protein NOP53 n=1 Tax=Asbolus verrucosus TaxID=1661398 RepID=A0A482VWW8_ASBVE|nr:hypothetical protein BDFB_003251 [Asbolus verrucosus]
MLSTTVKKKRVSKKNKSSWRKHVNINDVEEFLEDQRLEERLGPPLATLTNDELFKVETKPSEELSAKERKKLKLSRPPRCFAVLQPHTNVPDPIKKRNRVRTKEERKNELIKKKEASDLLKGIVKHRKLQAVRDRKVTEDRKAAEPKRGEFNRNIWDEKDLADKDNWLFKETIKHNLRGTGKLRKTVKNPERKKASILPSVELPHPGTSYNPSFGDHQDLLKIVTEKESAIIKEQNHLNRVTRDMFSKMTAEKHDSTWLKEMSEGLPQEGKQDEEVESDDEYKSLNPPVKNTKKTLKQRRKQREQLKLGLLKKTLKLEKKKVTDIHQLKILNKDIEKTEIKSNILREKRKKMRLLKKKEPKRLSATKFEETEIEFNMGQDIAGNLRNLKKEGNLLTDRFKSLQKRNIVEPSTRRHRKKGKVKIYTKPGHKEDWIKTVAR